MNKNYHTIRLILGDQLNMNHSWIKKTEEGYLYVMMECLSETNYTKHHIQKIVAFFLAMRHYADGLKAQGHEVVYLELDDDKNQQSFTANLKWLIERYNINRIEYQLPDEYRLDKEFKNWPVTLDVEVEAVDTEHFLTDRAALADFFKGKKQYLMESFYRMMRKKYNILMEEDGKTPLTGRWNYDAENRKKLPKNMVIPPQTTFFRKVRQLVTFVGKERRGNYWPYRS